MSLQGLLHGLEDIAGVPRGGTSTRRFTIPGEAGAAPVQVVYQPGTHESVSLRAPYGQRAAATVGHRSAAVAPRVARPLRIRLRRENAKDGRRKARGVDREVQTGDAEFDGAVYVDTTAPDQAVLFVLSPPEVRSAVRTLLVDVELTSIEVDDEDGCVEARIDSFPRRDPPDPDRARRVLQSFRTLVQSLPMVDGQGKRRDAPLLALRALALAAVASFVLEAVVVQATLPRSCRQFEGQGCVTSDGVNCCRPLGVGLLCGALIGLAAGLLVARLFRGQSRSSSRRVWAVLFIVVIAIDLAQVAAECTMW